MITVRTFWSPAQAGLAKSVLDNYEIPCALLDENASCYNMGQQVAVPIRLVVEDEDATRAISVLNADFEKAGELDASDKNNDVSIEQAADVEKMNRNPWELLTLAFYLLLPAICILFVPVPTLVTKSSWTQYLIAGTKVAHLLSWLSIILATLLVGFYFRVRQSSAKSRNK
jgi:hypothetical protein